jgi:hypothetical protein
VAGALIDRALEMLLRHFFVSRGASQQECDELLTDGFLPPRASMGLRIRMAKCLGLFDRELAGALNYVRDWRNHFAHEPLPQPLTEEISAGLLKLFPHKYAPVLEAARASIKEHIEGEAGPRWLFLVGCTALDLLLLRQADQDYGELVPGERG